MTLTYPVSNDTKAILLLCGNFAKQEQITPLSQAEYTNLVRFLIAKKLRPSALFDSGNISDFKKGVGIVPERLESLLNRGVQLSLAIERWNSEGIWIVSRGDPDYPARYKTHLSEKAPPLLFGIGNRTLLQGGGFAIVGSRDAEEKGLDFTGSKD